MPISTARRGYGAHGFGRRDPVDALCSAAAAYRLAGRALAVRAAGVDASAAPRTMAGYGRAGYCMSARYPSVLRQTASPERTERAGASTLTPMYDLSAFASRYSTIPKFSSSPPWVL